MSSIAYQVGEALSGARAVPIREVTEGDARVLRALAGVMWAVGLAAALSATLAAGAAMAATLQERRREMALLRVLGAGRRGVVWQFLGEAAVIGGLAGALGYLLGGFLADRMGQVVFGAGLPLQPVLAPVSLAVGVGLAAAGTAPVLRRVLADPPATVLAGTS